MATTQQYFNLVQTGKSSWIAVHIDPAVETANQTNCVPVELFGRAATTRLTLAERFPRVTIAVVALALFTATLTMEVDLLRGAGFRWQ
jgi:hypothetical protein